ncbi:glycosyltransferase family 2 protein [Ferruginibacter albus]|uniref:glycosyltransferase family 2 protein n=1 Tax=Ferruginibacter albus TaxID=2875540 RepID=UPI001CC65FCA|nr:glycosyltransferase family 2 protein [Ferruginibacter albus]UAY50692.1 glycosyltransferase [Ferruginibacter albus]
MSKILVSIIIPTYNSASTLKQALDSVLNQTYTNYEILIIDGASSDNTISIVKQYQESFNSIRVISEKDNGIYDAMNKGTRLAEGEWLYFLGSDDYLIDENLLKYIFEDTYEQNRDFHFLYGNVFWGSTPVVYMGEFNKYMLSRRNICHQAIFYKKTIHTEFDYSYDVNNPALADWKLNIQCFLDKRIKVKYLPVIVARFNILGSSKDFIDGFRNEIKALYSSYFSTYTYIEKLKFKIFMPEEFGSKNIFIKKFQSTVFWFYRLINR